MEFFLLHHWVILIPPSLPSLDTHKPETGAGAENPVVTFFLDEVIPKKGFLIFSFICLDINVSHFQALVSLNLFQEVFFVS